ncbi:Deuterolysin metalloprotease family-domain-containing protein [Xylaria nigripes]|nr:Deuterolysin metalloprotease family-domain-containing protein [Xylaria nigripes]
MISNIIPLAALAGAALAACPLSVEITGATDHVSQVAVTNTDSEPITVFKGNTVLHDHATKDLQISDDSGKVLPFEGDFVKYKRTNITLDMFQTIQPGETINTSVNAAITYKLAGVKQANVSALQSFHYVKGTTAPKSLEATEFCEVTSNSMTIIPDQSKVALEHLSSGTGMFNSRIKKRDINYSSCSGSQTSDLKTSVSNAISMSKAASTAAGSSTNNYYFRTWFKSDSVIPKVQSIYNSVVDVQDQAPTISCVDPYSICDSSDALLYARPSENLIVPCPNNGFWGFPELASNCAGDDLDRAGSILHECTHLFGTHDHAYGQRAALQLTADQAADNADTYEIYAGSVRLGGCSS